MAEKVAGLKAVSCRTQVAESYNRKEYVQEIFGNSKEILFLNKGSAVNGLFLVAYG